MASKTPSDTGLDTAKSSSDPLTAAVYARVSTPDQKSTENQVELCRRRCETAGYEVRFILREEGFSAKTAHRPKFKRLLQLCRQGRIDVIVVWKLDRLCRSLRDLLNTHEFLEEHGVTLCSVTENIDTSSSFGRFAFRNIVSAAELESDLIGERAQMGKMNNAQEGKWLTNQPPYGYELTENRELEVNQEEAEVVKHIFQLYTEERLPLTEISRRLGGNDVRTKSGRSFSPSAIHRLVRNPVYQGDLKQMGVERRRPDLAIVDQEVWQTAQEREGEVCRDGNAQERREEAIDAVFSDYFQYLEEMHEEVLELRVSPPLRHPPETRDAGDQPSLPTARAEEHLPPLP